MDPERIGRVRVGRLLSRRSTMSVYAGVDSERAVPVAIKIMDRSPGGGDADERRAFLDAARRLGLLESDRIGRVFDAGELADGRAYAITELADRGRLTDRIAERGGRPFGVAEALALSVEFAECLLAAHGHGIWYRNPTPDSVGFVSAAHAPGTLDDSSGQRERMIIDDFSVVPMIERVGASPADERTAVHAAAAGLYARLRKADGSAPPSGHVWQPKPDDSASVERAVVALIAGETAGLVAAAGTQTDPAPTPAAVTAPTPAEPEADDTIVLPRFVESSRPRLPARAAAVVLAAGLVAGIAIGWGVTRSRPVAASAPRADVKASPSQARPSTSQATTKPSPGASAASPAGALDGPSSSPAGSAGSAAPAATPNGTTSAAPSKDDPQGRAGRYAGFITATSDGCGTLKQGKNYGIVVNVSVENQGRSAIFLFRLSYRDDPVTIQATLAANGAFRGEYNIDGTEGTMSGHFAGDRIVDVKGSEGDCGYAWSATRKS